MKRTLYINRVDLSGVADHSIMLDHQMDWKNPQLLDRERNVWSRKVKEAVWLRKTTKTMNKDRDVELNQRFGLA